MMFNLMKPRVHKDENENLEDVRGIQLSNAIENMDVGELRPRQVNDDGDDPISFSKQIKRKKKRKPKS